MSVTISEVLTLARAAAEAKALAIWERDGKQDRGSCGSAIMYLKASTKLGKEALALGFAHSSCGDISVKHFMPIRLTPTDTHASILPLKRGERR